jgi:hypothetical protein
MKKTWIKIKRGILEPKHRRKLGAAWFLFFYMLDKTNWEDGIIYDWKDEAAADELEIPLSTLRDHRRKLENNLYIATTQKQYTLEIAVKNWTNPREYDGTVYNSKQGDKKTTPQNDEDYTQGDTQGNEKLTPLHHIHRITQSHISEPEKFECDDDGNPLKKTRKQKEVDMMDGVIHYAGINKSPLEKKIALYPVDVQKTLADLVDIYKWPVAAIPDKSKGGKYALWIKDIRHINELIAGYGRRALEATFEPCSKLSPGAPGSIIWSIPGIVGKMTKKQETAKIETPFSKHMENYVPRRREV